MQFLENHQVREVGAPIAAAANTDGNSDRIDMQGFEAVTFLVPITDSANTGVATLAIEQNDADSDTGMTAVDGAVATVTSAADDDLNGQLLAVEVIKPTKRYVQAVRTSETANIAFGNVIAILQRPRKRPVTQDATVADYASVADDGS